MVSAVVGVFGETLSDWAKNLFEVAEASLELAAAPAAQLSGIELEDLTGSSGKDVCVAMAGLGLVVPSPVNISVI